MKSSDSIEPNSLATGALGAVTRQGSGTHLRSKKHNALHALLLQQNPPKTTHLWGRRLLTKLPLACFVTGCGRVPGALGVLWGVCSGRAHSGRSHVQVKIISLLQLLHSISGVQVVSLSLRRSRPSFRLAPTLEPALQFIILRAGLQPPINLGSLPALPADS